MTNAEKLTAYRRSLYHSPMSLVARRLDTPVGRLTVAAGPAGVCRISFAGPRSKHWAPWFDRHFGARPRRGDDPLLALVEKELGEYFKGRRRTFDVKLDRRGTEFQRAVWKLLEGVPFGSTISYGEVARRLGRPAATRAVGGAVGDNPLPIVIPCHRVLGSGGELVGFGGGIGVKEQLLELEGLRIPFG